MLTIPTPHRREIARVLRSALDQARPVYIELPRDMVAVPGAPVPAYAATPADPEPLADCAEEIIERLAAGQRAGRPGRRRGPPLRPRGPGAASWRASSGIPVVTTFMGRGLLTARPTSLLGTYLGVAGDPAVAALVEGSDGLLLLGVILSRHQFRRDAGQLDLRAHHAAPSTARSAWASTTYRDIPLADLVEALAGARRARSASAARRLTRAIELSARA